MIDKADFEKKKIVFFYPAQGDIMRFRNDNLLIQDREGHTKLQITCYGIFLIFVAGDTSLTTGLLNRANKYGFSLCFLNRNLKMYKFIGARMEGNTLLRKCQYGYEGLEQARVIVKNKIQNQRIALNRIRKKTPGLKEAIAKLDGHILAMENSELNLNEIMGIEGSAARCYFVQIFSVTTWKGRKPRIKSDYVNSCLDIGYTILFNIMDGLINVFGFDEYYGVLHRCFYMRKSLVCDLMESFRPIIDYCIRKNINLNHFREEDFENYNGRYVLEWKNSQKYTQTFLEAILEYKGAMFTYVRDYYRAVMKHKEAADFPVFTMEE